MSHQILVPYDGSQPARKALEYSFEMFPNAEVTAVYVVPIPSGYWAAFEDPDAEIPLVDRAREVGREFLDDAEAFASEHDREIGTELTTGQPHNEIVDQATDGDYDTIVIGSHGREGISRILLGSVAETVVRRAPIPVVVVR